MTEPYWLYRSDAAAQGRRVPLAELFEYPAHAFADRPAISDGERAYTFGQIALGARRIGAMLGRLGVRRGDAVVVLTSKHACIPIFAAAIWRAGAVYVPVDNQNPVARTRSLLARIDPAAVLGERADLEKIGGRAPSLSFGELLGEVEAADDFPVEASPEVSEDDPAYIMFTSGSTGRPKGVVISHRSLLDYFHNHNQVLRFTAASRVLSFAPFHFDVSIEDTLLPLSLGAFVYQFRGMPIGHTIHRLLRRERITHVIAVSTILALMTGQAAAKGEDALPDLEMVMTGAEACDPRVIDTWRRLVPRARVINAYGPTEATIVCLTHTIVDVEPERTRSYPIGRPLSGVSMKLVGPAGEITAPNVEGELWIGGSQVMTGYFKEPEETARAIVVEDGCRFYKTGDVCRFDATGAVEFIGRVDDEVKIAGRRINLREVSQPALAQGAHAFAGVLSEGGKAQLALIFVGDSAMLDVVDLRLAEQLPAYMRPNVLASARPVLTSTGKIDERELLARLRAAWERSPATRYLFTADGTFAPHSRSLTNDSGQSR